MQPDRKRNGGNHMRRIYDNYWRGQEWQPTRDLSCVEQRLLRDLVGTESRVLDLGCGDGAHYGTYVQQRAAQYLGLDVSGEAVTQARSRGLLAQVHDLNEPLPVANDSFDVVLCFEVLEHLIEPEEAVREAHRVLRDGGVFLSSVPNVAAAHWRVELMVRGRFVPGGSPASFDEPWRDPHIRFFTCASIVRLLYKCGFREVRLWGENCCFPVDMPYLSRLCRAQPWLAQRLRRCFEPLGRWWPGLFAGTLLVLGHT